jgi:NMD protein affecting ribosome stability and mRNA decay
MICKICGINETDNPDSICDDCATSIIINKDIPPNEEDFF